MSGDDRKLLTPKYDHEFDAEMSAVHSDWFRVEDFVSGVEWVLVHEPRSGHHLSEQSMMWCIPAAGIDDVPPVMIYYSFDDQCVYFHSIKVVDAGD